MKRVIGVFAAMLIFSLPARALQHPGGGGGHPSGGGYHPSAPAHGPEHGPVDWFAVPFSPITSCLPRTLNSRPGLELT